MKRRIVAIIGLIFLLLLYLVTIIMAFINQPFAYELLQFCIFCTIVVPAVLYAFLLSLRFYKKDKDK